MVVGAGWPPGGPGSRERTGSVGRYYTPSPDPNRKSFPSNYAPPPQTAPSAGCSAFRPMNPCSVLPVQPWVLCFNLGDKQDKVTSPQEIKVLGTDWVGSCSRAWKIISRIYVSWQWSFIYFARPVLTYILMWYIEFTSMSAEFCIFIIC